MLLIFKTNDNDFMQESGFPKNDINSVCLECKNILIEQNEDYLDYIKIEEESINENILNK